MAWAATDQRLLAAARRWLASYVVRDADRAALKGTPFDVSTAVVDHMPESGV